MGLSLLVLLVVISEKSPLTHTPPLPCVLSLLALDFLGFKCHSCLCHRFFQGVQFRSILIEHEYLSWWLGHLWNLCLAVVWCYLSFSALGPVVSLSVYNNNNKPKIYLLFETYNIYGQNAYFYRLHSHLYRTRTFLCFVFFLLGGCGVTRNKNCQERKKNSVRKIFVLSGTKKSKSSSLIIKK